MWMQNDEDFREGEIDFLDLQIKRLIEYINEAFVSYAEYLD